MPAGTRRAPELLLRGYDEDAILDILYGNSVQFLREAWQDRNQESQVRGQE